MIITRNFLTGMLCLVLVSCSLPQWRSQPAGTPSPAPATPTSIAETPTLQPLGIEVQESADCLTGPGEGYTVVLQVVPDQKLKLVGKDAEGKYWIVLDPKNDIGCWLASGVATVQGPVDGLPVLPPPPIEVTRPEPPDNFKIRYTCSKVPIAGTTIGNQKQDKYRYHVTFHITWEDRSDNETGFEIYKNRNLFLSVGENVTEAIDAIDLPTTKGDTYEYSIQAINPEGKSPRRNTSVTFFCQ